MGWRWPSALSCTPPCRLESATSRGLSQNPPRTTRTRSTSFRHRLCDALPSTLAAPSAPPFTAAANGGGLYDTDPQLSHAAACNVSTAPSRGALPPKGRILTEVPPPELRAVRAYPIACTHIQSTVARY